MTFYIESLTQSHVFIDLIKKTIKNYEQIKKEFPNFNSEKFDLKTIKKIDKYLSEKFMLKKSEIYFILFNLSEIYEKIILKEAKLNLFDFYILKLKLISKTNNEDEDLKNMLSEVIELKNEKSEGKLAKNKKKDSKPGEKFKEKKIMVVRNE